jgi:hypothetical protein
MQASHKYVTDQSRPFPKATNAVDCGEAEQDAA